MVDGVTAHLRYLERARQVIDQIATTQLATIDEVARRCAEAILADGLVHLFGSGHSRIAVEEMFPRYGSFPGFHPIVESSLTQYHQVVGANGMAQAMFLENVEELGRAILDNFRLDPDKDLMFVISAGGTNAVPIEVALEAKSRGLPVIAMTSVAHSTRATSNHSSGKRLFEVADIVLDLCTPVGDAGVAIDGLETPVGPLTTIANALIINMIKTNVAERLTAAGHPPPVITSGLIVGDERAKELFRRSLERHAEMRRRL
jgi:uncharacterized phosphosugar-binding protein